MIKRDEKFPVLIDKIKPCSDCAANNLYGEITQALKQEPLKVQKLIKEKWFCHCNPETRCAGVNL